MPILNMCPGGSGAKIPLEAPTNLLFEAHNKEIWMTWTDPVNKYATPGGELVSDWAYTLVVRKEGSTPTSPYDGTQVYRETTRNAHTSTVYMDSVPSNGILYYYALYAFTTFGVYSEPLTGSAMAIGGVLTYYGTTPMPLSEPRTNYGAAVANNQYAIYVAGSDSFGSSGDFASVEAYDSNLTKVSSTIDDWPNVCKNVAATSFRNYAIFGGGNRSTWGFEDVMAYDEMLVRTALDPLDDDSTAYSDWALTSCGANSKYAIFAGGEYSDGNYPRTGVVAYDSDLVRIITEETLDVGGAEATSATLDNTVFFINGYNNDNASVLGRIHMFDENLTYTSAYSDNYIPPKRAYIGAAVTGEHIVLGGGYKHKDGYFDDNKKVTNAVNAIDKDLIATEVSSLSEAKARVPATSLGRYAVFGGGMGLDAYDSALTPGPAWGSNVVEAYDDDLVKTISHTLSSPRYGLKAVTIQNYALFASGVADTNEGSIFGNSGTVVGDVDVFTLEEND